MSLQYVLKMSGWRGVTTKNKIAPNWPGQEVIAAYESNTTRLFYYIFLLAPITLVLDLRSASAVLCQAWRFLFVLEILIG